MLSGAAVAGVAIQAANLATNVQREAMTDASGAYSLPNLPPGTYRVTATKTGFQVARAESVTLQVEQAARLDLRLEVGNVSESVEVSATAALLQTENASVGTVIDSAKIVDLPLNGRNFIQLAQLIPGVQAGTPGSITVRRGRGSVGQTDAAYGSTAASANGSRDTANRFYIDGVEVMDYDAMTYSFSPSVDSLSEFKVQTSTYSAEYGGAPGGQVNMITKSGTNRLHGTLWEFNRNDQLTQSYDAIAGKSVTSPRLNRNQFGANIGGPIWIPKVYKGTDKTFFFFNWESGYAATGASSAFRIVPTEAMRNGDFRGLVDARTRLPIILKDPLNIGIVGNVLPKAALSKEALAYLPFEPLPNTSNGTFNFATTAASATSTQRNFLGRVDRTLSSKDQVFGRYLFNDTYEAGTPIWGHDERNNLGRTQNFAASWTHIFRPTLINELRGGWHRFNEAEVFGTTNDANYDVVGKMGLPLVSRLPEEYGPPTISLNGPDGVYNTYDLQRQIGPRIRSNSIAPFTDVISWQKGRHFLKFDTEVDRRGVTFGQARAPRGSFSFDGTYTGSAMADFMLGYIRSDSVNPAHTSTDLYNYWVALSANDDFKVTPRLTLNFGVRWDYFQRYKQKDDQMVNIQLNGFVVGDTVTTKTSPFGRELMAADWNNVGPRFGFAWRPPVAGETVVRGGYGIYYTPADLERHLRHGRRRAGHGRRLAQRQHRGRAEPVLQQSLRRRGHQRRAQLRGEQRPEHARQLHPAVELQRAAQTAGQRRARCGLRRQQGHQAGGDLRRSEPPDSVGGPAHSRARVAQRAPAQPDSISAMCGPTRLSATRSITRSRPRPSAVWGRVSSFSPRTPSPRPSPARPTSAARWAAATSSARRRTSTTCAAIAPSAVST